MKKNFFLLFILPILSLAQLPPNISLPDPHLVIVGPAKAGKSSLANALLGCDPRSTDCLFEVCYNLDACAKETMYGIGQWLGNAEQNFTVVDTPGFGDMDVEDSELIEEMLDVLKNSIKQSDTILLLLDGRDASLPDSLLDMLTKMSMVFGKQWWEFLVVGVSFWPYDQDSIDQREDNCINYPDQCMDEAWFMREINSQLHQKFHLDKNFTFAFIDSWSQTEENIDDEVQQEHFQEEAEVLLEEMTQRNHSFVFKGIDDVLEENADMKERIMWLEDVITNNISQLVDRMDHQEDSLGRMHSKITHNEKHIRENSDAIDTNMKTNTDMINTNSQQINTNSQQININTGKINTNTFNINTNRGNIYINANDISTNYAMIDTNTQRISSNNVSINTHDQKISTNTELINTNSANIAFNAQYVAVCAYRWYKIHSAGPISYENITIQQSSDNSTINIETGEFTAGTTGVYSLTYSAHSRDTVEIKANKDGVELGREASYYSTSDEYDEGSRTWLMCIKKNEKVNLKATHIEKDTEMWRMTWCVDLVSAHHQC